jgi:methylenetetrahydrofolate reductase (NADPH)
VTRISIELVPRSAASIASDLDLVAARFPGVDTVNIPDLLRFELRSWEACGQARRRLARAIPHLRAMDFAPAALGPLLAKLDAQGLGEVLVVRGDPPQEPGRAVYPTRAEELVAALKHARPGLRVYAAVDPYRSGARDELELVRRKRDAGADGFFSQPFFDLRLLDVWGDLLAGEEVYWGLSPVVGPRARRYWETKNRAFFPGDFKPEMGWNRELAARALSWARERGTHLYFMPIRVDLEAWLGGVL